MATAISSESLPEEAPRGPSIAEVLPFGVMLLAHAPILSVYLRQLWSRPHYQFFPLVLLAFGYLFATRWPQRTTPARRQIALSRLMLLSSLALLCFAFARLSPLACYFSSVILIGAFILRFGVPSLGPWLLLFLLIRIPYGQDVALIQWMQQLTTKLSSTALDSIGVEHVIEGNVLVFPSRSLFVEEACSGVVSMLAIIASAAIVAVLWRRSLLHGLLLMATGVFWAGGMNVIRVVSIAITLTHYGIDLTEGWRHELLGLCVFAVSLIALFSTDRLMMFLFGRMKMNPLASYWGYAEGNWLVRLWNLCSGQGAEGDFEESYGDYSQDWDQRGDSEEFPASKPPPAIELPVAKPRPWEWVLVPVFLLLGGVQVVAGIGPFSVAPALRQDALDLGSDDLPDILNGWNKIDFEVQQRDSFSAFGEHSRLWTYQKGYNVARLSLDFVFPEWHALTACYAGTGWIVESQSRVGDDGTQTEARFAKPNGEHAYLMYDLFDAQGRDYLSPSGSFFHPQLRRILSGEASRFTLPSYYQVQVLVGIPEGPLSEEDRQSIGELFLEFEAQMKARITGRDASVHPDGD